MKREVKIIIADSDNDQCKTLSNSLRKAGIHNDILYMNNSDSLWSFLFENPLPKTEQTDSYLLFMTSGLTGKSHSYQDVMKRLKTDTGQNVPKTSLIMVAEADDDEAHRQCREMGCKNIITKPIAYEMLLDVLRKEGLCLMIVYIPTIKYVPSADADAQPHHSTTESG